MKVCAICNNQAFKGLFVDKTKDDNWLMEYHPYSWENPPYKDYYGNPTNMYDVKKVTMDNKRQIDVFADKLPNNEEIYTPMTNSSPAISKDILGTTSYYEYPVNVKLGEYRDRITVAEPMNYEDSLKVYLKKHEKFAEMKKEELPKIKNIIESNLDNLKSDIVDCDYYSKEAQGINLFSDARVQRGNAFYKIFKTTLPELLDIINKYVTLVESGERVKSFIDNMRAELKLISQKKQSGDIIDISIRNTNDPNKPLYDECLRLVKNPEEMEKTQKLVLLAHRSIPLKEMMDNWIQRWKPIYNFKNMDSLLNLLPQGITELADDMIGHRL